MAATSDILVAVAVRWKADGAPQVQRANVVMDTDAAALEGGVLEAAPIGADCAIGRAIEAMTS